MVKLKTRLYVDGILERDIVLPLSCDHAHFLNTVLRLRAGDMISLFNATYGEWSANLENLGKRQGDVRLNQQLRSPDPESGPWLAFAPVKKKRTDFIVEKATELGVERLIPVFTVFTDSRRINIDRFESTAIEAAEQCQRLSIPQIGKPCSLEELITAWPEDRTLFVADEKGGGMPLAEAVSAPENKTRHGFLIGPEGGFGNDELAFVKAQGFCQPVDLGRRILRAETAAISVLSVYNALLGR